MNELPLIHRAITHGNRTALLNAGQAVTYAELIAASKSVAVTLLDNNGDLNQQRVAYCLPAGQDYVAAQWGIWRSGGIAVPLSLSAMEPELRYALEDSGAEQLLVSRDTESRFSAIANDLGLKVHCVATASEKPRRENRLPKVDTDRGAMMLYTSGTTNKPKGVLTTHDNVTNQIESLVTAWQWQTDDTIPLFLPLHHIHGIINVLSCALWIGGRVDCFHQFETDAILSNVAKRNYSVFMAVPTIYVRLIETLHEMSEPNRKAITDGFAAMRLMVSGSAALPASVHETWSALTQQRLLERYGMTEVGMALSNAYDGERRPGAVGKPLPGVEIRLMNDSGQIVKDENEPGEIQIRGPAVFREYWNKPEATKESFLEGWFKSGDIAVVEDGYYRIMGRSSVDIIKSGGYKLSALEIESVLLEHEHITQCAVVGIPDETWGEAVAVALVLTPGHAVGDDDLKAWCKQRMSKYKTPKLCCFVDTLPRNAMGKVTKPDVAKLFRT